MKPPPPIATVLSKNQESNENGGQFLCLVEGLQSSLHILCITYAYPAAYENGFNLSLRSLSRTLTLSRFLPDS